MFVLASAAFAVGQKTNVITQISELTEMSGCWEMRDDSRKLLIIENWSPATGKSMVGLGQTLSYGSAVIDPGNGTMSYAWSVKRNGVAFDLGTGVTTNRSSFSFTPADSGNYIATLVVNDGKGGITSASSGVTSVLSLLAA